MTAPEKFKYIITRQTKKPDRWKVVPADDNPKDKPLPGSVVSWEFGQGEQYPGLEAHFQFCHFVLERALDHGKPREVCFVESQQINDDWAASIPNSQSTEALTGTLRPGVPQAKAMHYAVWIVDPDGPKGDKKGINDFAIGENPPPKLDTGP